jgi:NitT/TauT family transport system ATP-binding protein
MVGAEHVRFECSALSKSYDTRGGRVTALDEVSFGAQGHEFVGIVGPSGCGKTTLLKLIAGLIDPTSGSVRVTQDEQNGGPLCAFVFQDHGLFPWMSVLDNVAFGLEMQGVGRAERRDRSRAFIDRVGLGPFADSYPHQLSVGMRQRVGIVRAFVMDPPLLLMDEPFGALDSQTRRVLQGELLRLWREQRGIVVFVTHDIDEAVRLSDRILVMTGRPGQIREEIPIPLERPRDLSRLEPREISEIKWHIWNLLENEVRRSLGIDE